METRIRTIFGPPPVDEEEAPSIISRKSSIFANVGHTSKFVVAKPVVVMTDAT